MNPGLPTIGLLKHNEEYKDESVCHVICVIRDNVASLTINNIVYKQVSNALFFLKPGVDWSVVLAKGHQTAGYVLSFPPTTLDHSLLSKLHINEVRLFAGEEIPRINLAPGIEKRIVGILEMIDELNGSKLNHKEDAILSLLNTFFVYCDGQCNIRSVISDSNAKKELVFRYKKLVNKWYAKHHDVEAYAQLLHVSSKYLNECVKETLNTTAKRLIIEQRIMKARHELKFSTKTVKEIGFELGFSSPDYFSYFYKQHTGIAPSSLRNNQ